MRNHVRHNFDNSDEEEINLVENKNSTGDNSERLMHEIWVHNRIAEGWVYGEIRDDNLKTHPLLVPYDELSEFEKI